MATNTDLDVDFGSVPRINNTVENFSLEPIVCQTQFPLTIGASSSPLVFVIPQVVGQLIDLNRVFLRLEVKVWKKGPNAADGTATWAELGTRPNVAPYNALLYTLFNEIECDFNNQLVWSTRGHYQHYAYLHLLCKTTELERRSVLQAALWAPDLAGGFDAVSANMKSANPGSYYRLQTIDKGASLHLYGRLLLDCFMVSRPLLDNVSVTLRMYPTIPERCLLVPDGSDHQLKIMKAELVVARIQPRIMRHSCVYPYVRFQIQRYLFPKGSQSVGPITIARSIIPRRVWVAIQDEDRYNGSYKLNRLRFHHYDVERIALRLNGVMLPFKYPTDCNFDKYQYYHHYVSLFHEAGREPSELDFAFNLAEYRQGYTIWCFDTSRGHQYRSEDEYDKGQVGGVLELLAYFSVAPTKNLVFLMFSEHEQTFTVRKDSSIVINESPNTK